MNWPIRLLISGATMVCGIVVKTGVFPQVSDGSISRVQAASNTRLASQILADEKAETETSLIEIAEPIQAGSYQSISERNPFRLKPPHPPAPTPALAVEPKEDLYLTGIASNGCRYALFMVTEPGQPPIYFRLAEGDKNAWLELKAVDFTSGTVTALLKKPVMRIRNVGAEVVLSLDTHGIKNHLYQ